jgi:hypothetical protein
MFRCAQCQRRIHLVEAVSWWRQLQPDLSCCASDALAAEEQIAFACPQCGLQFQVPRDGAFAAA